jgi:hypothetical protein
MGPGDWEAGVQCFGLMFDGRAQPTGIRKRGEDATSLMIFNAWRDVVEFTLPSQGGSDQHWTLMIDADLSEEMEERETQTFSFGRKYTVTTPSFLLFALAPDEGGAVREGRGQEFARFPEFADPKQRERIPDPQSPATFESAKRDWDLVDPVNLARYRALIFLRRREMAPLPKQIRRGGEGTVYGDGAVEARWQIGLGAALALSANLSGLPVEFPPAAGRILWSEGEVGYTLGPWSVRWSLEKPQ